MLKVIESLCGEREEAATAQGAGLLIDEANQLGADALVGMRVGHKQALQFGALMFGIRLQCHAADDVAVDFENIKIG